MIYALIDEFYDNYWFFLGSGSGQDKGYLFYFLFVLGYKVEVKRT